MEKEKIEDERQYKMLKKLIAKEAKTGSTSLYYDESYLFNDVISNRDKANLEKYGKQVWEILKKCYAYLEGGLLYGNTWDEFKKNYVKNLEKEYGISEEAQYVLPVTDDIKVLLDYDIFNISFYLPLTFHLNCCKICNS